MLKLLGTTFNEMKKHLLVFVALLTTSIIVTWPLIFHLNSAIVDPIEGLLSAWIMNWNIHTILSGPFSWFNFTNANIFSPYHNTLAFSDYHLPGSILALPFVVLFREPLLAFNLNLLFGFVLTGFSLHLLVQHLTKNSFASFLAAFVGTFSIQHLNFTENLQLLNLWPVFLAMFFLTKKNYWWFIASFIAGITTASLYFYFLLLFVCVYLFFEKTDRIRVFKSLCLSFVFSSFFFIPFWVVLREFHSRRSIAEIIQLSLRWPDLLTTSFLGLGMAILISFFLIKKFVIKEKSQSGNEKFVWVFTIVGLLSLALSFGPFFHVFPDTISVGKLPAIPMPYLIPYFLIPGFTAFETPSHWLILSGASLLIAAIVYFSKRITLAWVVVFCLITFWEIKTPMTFYAVPRRHEFPVEQEWLANNFIGEPIIQFPINTRLDQPGVRLETLRMYYSTIHWHPMFNGYSTFSLVEWEKRVKFLQNSFPSKDSLLLLKRLKIKLVLTPRSWAGRMSEFPEVKLLKEFPGTVIYQIN